MSLPDARHPELDYVADVLTGVDGDDFGMLLDDANARLWRGWSAGDVRRWLRSVENVNPSLPEKEGLRRMRELRQKYGETP